MTHQDQGDAALDLPERMTVAETRAHSTSAQGRVKKRGKEAGGAEERLATAGAGEPFMGLGCEGPEDKRPAPKVCQEGP